MNHMQKIALAAAIAGALIIILRKAMAYERAEREGELPTLQPVQDAEPLQPEPLPADDLRVAQNSPL
jgi:hypothetical protein